MERESTTHGRILDEEMKHEVDHQVDPGRDMEGLTEEPELVESPAVAPGALSDADIRRRSELAQSLRPSIFPAYRDAIVECAIDEDAPPSVLELLQRLPAGVEYHTTEEVWESLGGRHEVREQEHEQEHEQEPDAMQEPPVAPQTTRRFDFRFDMLHRVLGLPFGVTPGSTHVEVDRERNRFVARFGPWVVDTPLSNIRDASLSGGYFPLKTVGPAHLSLTDHGLTFATNDAQGVCVRFDEAVTGIDPRGLLHHPGLTVTVADPEGLVEALRDR